MLETFVILFCIPFAIGQVDPDTEDILRGFDKLIDNESDDYSVITRAKPIVEEARYSWNFGMPDLDIFLGAFGLFYPEGYKRWGFTYLPYQIACYQGRNENIYNTMRWCFEKYNKYGCYCGIGFYYGNSMDATDTCCKSHDLCYLRAIVKYKLTSSLHSLFIPYSVSCCRDKNYTKCTDSGPSAGRDLCECDQKFAHCLTKKQVVNTYNSSFKNDRSKCIPVMEGSISLLNILIAVPNIFKSALRLPQTISSQGSCPIT